MRRRTHKPLLWAVLRPSLYGTDGLHAVPSSEAGLAACVEPEDRVVRWTFSAEWHAQESSAFLASLQSGAGH